MARYKSKSTEIYRQEAQKFLAREDEGYGDIIIKSAKRSQVVDKDNRVYTDYCLGGGSLIHGHANRNVILGIKKIAERGVCFDHASSEEINLSSQIVRQIPGVDKVHFFASHEQTLKASIETAQFYTSKPNVITFDLCQCSCLKRSHMMVLPYNDTEALRKKIEQRNSEISCIVLETVSSQYGIVAAQKPFLKEIQSLSKKYNIVLIQDEYRTGFRNTPQSMQKDFALKASMVCLSGIVGGGFPLSALGLSKDFVQAYLSRFKEFDAPVEYLSPIMLRAGLDTLKLLSLNHYVKLNRRAEELSEDMNAYFQEEKVSARIGSYKSMMSLFFTDKEVYSKKDALKGLLPERYGNLRKFLLSEGILFPLRQTDPFFITLTHSRKELHKLLTSLKNFFRVRQ